MVLINDLVDAADREEFGLVDREGDITDAGKRFVQLAKIFSDQTRITIFLALLQEKEINVSALCDKLGQSQPAVSHHLNLMQRSGVLTFRRDGKRIFYSVTENCKRETVELVYMLLDGLFKTDDPDVLLLSSAEEPMQLRITRNRE